MNKLIKDLGILSKNGGQRRRYGIHQCSTCNAQITIRVSEATNNRTCNTCRYEKVREASSKHGDTNTRLYCVWISMVGRCHGKTGNPRYKGRGIQVCSEWRDYTNFKQWALSNGYARGLTIDRINNDGNYAPDNCRWVTTKVNSRNRSTTKLTTDDVVFIKIMIPFYKGNLIKLAMLFNVNHRTISNIKTGKTWNDVIIPIIKRGDVSL